MVTDAGSGAPSFFGNLRDFSLGIGEENHPPRHNQYNNGTNGGYKIRIDPVNTDLRQDREKCWKTEEAKASMFYME